MWRATYSLSYQMVSEWRPVFPVAEMLSAGGSQKPPARPFAKMSLQGSLLAPITGFWLALTRYWIQQKQKTTRKWRKRRRRGNCTEWPRFTTFCRFGRAAKTYLLPRRNLALKTSRWLRWDTFRTQKTSSMHRGHSLNIMVRLHSNLQRDLLCHHHCLERTSLEDELKYWMSTKSEESTITQSNVMSIAHLKAFRTLKIGLSGMGTWIIQITARTIAQRTLNLI